MRELPPPMTGLPIEHQGAQLSGFQNYTYGVGNDPYRDPFEDENSFDPLKLFWFVIHYRWLIAAFILAGIVSGVVFTYLQTPMYRASAKLEILTAGARIFQDLEVTTQSSGRRAFETAREKMKSRDLARRVVFALNLTEKYDFLAPTPSFSLSNLVSRIFGKTNDTTIEELDAETREAMAVGIVRRNFSVKIVRNTSILNVVFSHAIPSYSSEVANQIVKSFIDQNVDKKSETSDLARQFIVEQVRETKEKLQASEKALVEYAQQAGITITGDDVSLISQNISDINKALSEAVQTRLAAELYNQQVVDGDAASLPEVFDSLSIQATKEKVAELNATYQEKLGTLKPGFPEMRRLKAQINELRKQMNAEVVSIGKSVKIRYVQAKEKEKSLKLELRKLEKSQTEFQQKNIKYTILKRDVDSSRTQYDSLIGKMNEIGVGAELKSTNASIVDYAIEPGSPYSPRLFRTLIAAIALFCAMAAAFIYLLELMNNTFAVPDQLESELKIPVLGILPFTADNEIAEAFNSPTSPLSEAYRTLRTSVQFTGTDDSAKTIMVTSAEPSEGKTITAFKLAEDFSALGRRVLVIDSDLRKPRMHRMFKTDNGIGLSNLLTNVVRSGDVADLFRKTQNPKITFLSAGTIPPNPSDILMSQKMGLTLHYCAKKYDLVIIDSPPVMGLSDAPIISRQVDATLLVIAAKQSTRKSVKNAIARLRSAGGNIVGCAFTKFAVNKLDYNYSYRYMQYNYYAYGDGDGDGKKKRLENDGGNGKALEDNSANPVGPVVAFFSRFARRFG